MIINSEIKTFVSGTDLNCTKNRSTADMGREKEKSAVMTPKKITDVGELDVFFLFIGTLYLKKLKFNKSIIPHNTTFFKYYLSTLRLLDISSDFLYNVTITSERDSYE